MLKLMEKTLDFWSSQLVPEATQNPLKIAILLAGVAMLITLVCLTDRYLRSRIHRHDQTESRAMSNNDRLNTIRLERISSEAGNYYSLNENQGASDSVPEQKTWVSAFFLFALPIFVLAIVIVLT